MKSLVTYRPRSGLSLMNDFDRVFDSFFADSPVRGIRKPAVDVREEKDSYFVEVELPGMSEKNIDVKVEENLLTISSVEDEKKDDEKNRYLIRERRASHFSRSFVLPKDVQQDKINARFKDGILTLEIPRVPKQEPKKIEVKKA